MSMTWNKLIEKSERLQKDLAFLTAQLEGTTFDEIQFFGNDIAGALEIAEPFTRELCELAEHLEQCKNNKAVHRAENKNRARSHG